MLCSNTSLSSLVRTVVPQCIKKYSTKAFDIKQIARTNRENSSLDGVKKTVSKKLKKTKENKDVAEKAQNKIDVPDCFAVLLQSPMYAGEEVNVLNQSLFKDFVEGLDLSYLPSVSTVLDKSQPEKQRQVLDRWKASKTKELGGDEQFKKHMQDIIDKGLTLHKCIELALKGEKVEEVMPGSEGHWKSVQAVLGDVDNVRSLECDCVHPEMFYRGKFDCIAEFRGTLCLIEWKTSGTHKPILSATYDNPLQVAAYIGAVNRSGILKQFNTPNLKNGALVFAYPTGEPATVHMMSQKVCEKYWKKWLDRLYLYWVMQLQQSLEK